MDAPPVQLDLDFKTKRAIIEQILEKVVGHKNKITITGVYTFKSK